MCCLFAHARPAAATVVAFWCQVVVVVFATCYSYYNVNVVIGMYMYVSVHIYIYTSIYTASVVAVVGVDVVVFSFL